VSNEGGGRESFASEDDIPERNTWPGVIAEMRALQRTAGVTLARIEQKVDQVGHRLGDMANFATCDSLETRPISGRDLDRVRVLAVDDDPAIVRCVALQLQALGAEAFGAGSVTEAELVLAQVPIDVALVDLHVPQVKDGIALCEWIWGMHRGVQIVVMSGDTGAPALQGLPIRKLCKPFRAVQLRDRVLDALGHGGTSLRPTDRPPPPIDREAPTMPGVRTSPPPSTADESPQAKQGG